MDLRIYDSLEHYRPTHPYPTYFSKEYLGSQGHQNLFIAESKFFLVPFSLENQTAKSISKSPFGSVLTSASHSMDDMIRFHGSIKKLLRSRGIEKIEIKHPAPIYDHYVKMDELQSLGYDIMFEDINQHINLNHSWENRIHTMQKRKLKTLTEAGFSFKVMEDFKTLYRFIKVCREAQGLQINIEWDHLNSLINCLPHQYEAFSVERDGKLSAVCITVNVSKEVTYYYLPATSPLFRSQSPMVLLIAGMVNYYRSKGYKYLDLGVSSVKGKAQETLKDFKERMGGEVTKKPFLKLSL